MKEVTLLMDDGRSDSFEMTDAETDELGAAILYGNGWWRRRDGDGTTVFLNLRHVRMVSMEEVADE